MGTWCVLATPERWERCSDILEESCFQSLVLAKAVSILLKERLNRGDALAWSTSALNALQQASSAKCTMQAAGIGLGW